MNIYDLVYGITALSAGAIVLGWVITIIIIAVFYLLTSFAYYKALKMLNYQYTWFAFIPFLRTYGLTAAINPGNYDVNIVGINIQAGLFNFWWILTYVLRLVPAIGGLLGIVWSVLAGGSVFTSAYAILDNKMESEVKVLGYLSAIIGLIPIIKFLTAKYPEY